jgi:hypothetical protein
MIFDGVMFSNSWRDPLAYFSVNKSMFLSRAF